MVPDRQRRGKILQGSRLSSLTRRGACKPGSVPGVVSPQVALCEGPYAAAAAIPLGDASLHRSSDQPGLPGSETNPPIPRFRDAGAQPLFGLAPSGVYHAAYRYRQRGALLPHPFTLTGLLRGLGGLLSVALSLSFPGPENPTRPAGVTRHPCFVEPGLSSRSCDPAAARLPDAGGHLARPMSRSNRSSNRIPPISPSISPSMYSGRQRR